MKRCRELFCLILAVGLSALAAPLTAQVVTGQVADSMTGMPVGTGFVVLVDLNGSEVARALTDRDGRFRLDAPRGGTYRLKSERIGYHASMSDPLELSPGTVLEYTLAVTAIPILLSAVEVRGEENCQVSPEGASETGMLWEEIRKALAATTWDGTQEEARYTTYSFVRDRSANRKEIFSERGRTRRGAARQPYRSLPAAVLAQHGYIVEFADSTSYNLPDANILMDDSFLESHCFHAIRDTKNRPGQLGLAFEPSENRDVAEVTGALWLDEETSELLSLEVGFTKLPEGIEDDRVGGTVEFLMLPSGAWIIRRWEIRTPVLQMGRTLNPYDRGRRRVPSVARFRDIGGELLEIATSDGTKIYPPGLAHVVGTVYDSTRASYLSGVRIEIAGTGMWSETDATGAYHLAAALEGDQELVLSHPWLDSLAFEGLRWVELARGTTDTVRFSIPHLNTMMTRLCQETAGRSEFGAVMGRVGEEGSTEGAGGASVLASWQIVERQGDRLQAKNVEAELEAGGFGFYSLCGVPTGHPVRVWAERGRYKSRTASLIFPPADTGSLLLAWDQADGGPYDQSFGFDRRLLRLDMRLLPDRARRQPGREQAVLSGFVSDRTTGQPLGGVTVNLNGRDSTRTRADGTFGLVGVDWLEGANFIGMRRLGYGPWVQEIWLDEGDRKLELSVMLSPQAVALDPVEVTAAAVEEYLTDVGFFRRQRANVGVFMDHAEVSQRAERSRFVTELLTGVSGVNVLDSKRAGEDAAVQFRGMLSINPSVACQAPRIFVDGFLVGAEDLVAVVRPEDVYAIEAYRTPSEVPIEFGGAQSGCGVLLIWSRRGGDGG